MVSSQGRTYAEYLISLRCDVQLPNGFDVLYPYDDAEVQRVVRLFYERYLWSGPPRVAVFGINPGRFGAGVTGIAFTDPWALHHQLDIPTTLTGQRELSAVFISAVIDAYGGPDAFYRDVLLTALSPLGFVREGVNVNFYDDAALQQAIVPFISRHIRAVHGAGAAASQTLLLGSGKLKHYVQRYLGGEHALGTVNALDHPRFIMQYRRSSMAAYVARYVEAIQLAVEEIRQVERC